MNMTERNVTEQINHSATNGQAQRPVELWWLPAVGAALTIFLQIMWPLADGQQRTVLTIVTVMVFAGTSVAHTWLNFGAGWALCYLCITFAFAFAIEAVGTGTGFPFSPYDYTSALGIQVLSVPLIVPLAWAMTAYPVLLLARRLTNALGGGHAYRITCSAIGALAMTAWDLFLEPQMVSAGYWIWAPNPTSLPGVPGIPAVNYLGWLGASFVLMFLLSYLPARNVSEVVPATLWTWTWVGGIVSNAFFFDRPSVAFVGGVAMAVVTIPYLWLLITGRGDGTLSATELSRQAASA